MTEGYVAIPWMLLAVWHIVRDGRWRWTVLLGVSFATVIRRVPPRPCSTKRFSSSCSRLFPPG